jgi:hypothetical protein
MIVDSATHHHPRNQADGRAVAIKTLLPEFAVSDKSMRRFLREIDVAAAFPLLFDHDAI